MAVKVNPPPQVRIPRRFFEDPETRPYFEQVQNILFQLWNRTGGSNDDITDLGNEQVDTDNLFALIGDVEEIQSEQGFSDECATFIQEPVNVVTTAVNYTTLGTEVVNCTDAVTVTLNAEPDNQEATTVVITNGDVTIEGNGRDVMGDTDVTVIFANIQPPGVLDLLYLAETDEWVAV